VTAFLTLTMEGGFALMHRLHLKQKIASCPSVRPSGKSWTERRTDGKPPRPTFSFVVVSLNFVLYSQVSAVRIFVNKNVKRFWTTDFKNVLDGVGKADSCGVKRTAEAKKNEGTWGVPAQKITRGGYCYCKQ
jgi:hypothetical protein